MPIRFAYRAACSRVKSSARQKFGDFTGSYGFYFFAQASQAELNDHAKYGDDKLALKFIRLAFAVKNILLSEESTFAIYDMELGFLKMIYKNDNLFSNICMRIFS